MSNRIDIRRHTTDGAIVCDGPHITTGGEALTHFHFTTHRDDEYSDGASMDLNRDNIADLINMLSEVEAAMKEKEERHSHPLNDAKLVRMSQGDISCVWFRLGANRWVSTTGTVMSHDNAMNDVLHYGVQYEVIRGDL